MASKAEEIVSRNLRRILAELPIGADIPESMELGEVLSSFEFFVVEVINRVTTGWNESFDGFMPLIQRKCGADAAEFFGWVDLFGPQAPFQLRLQLVPFADEIAWLECSFARRQEPNLKDYYSLVDRRNEIDWKHRFAFGDARRLQGT